MTKENHLRLTDALYSAGFEILSFNETSYDCFVYLVELEIAYHFTSKPTDESSEYPSGMKKEGLVKLAEALASIGYRIALFANIDHLLNVAKIKIFPITP